MIRRLARKLLRRGREQPEPVAAPDPPSVPRDVQAELEQLMADEPVVLFMKGVPEFPQCGFSQRTVAVLEGLDVAFHAVDVLSDPDIREGVKEFGSWPTIPQLYVNGAFVGGCDIVAEMASDGSLSELLGLEPEPEPEPIQQTSVDEIAGWLERDEDFEFLDVRTHEEFAIARIEGSRLMTRDLLGELEALPKDTRIAFLCHHGMRSQAAARAFQSLGYTDLHNIVGGIDAWSLHVDADVPRY